LGFLEAYPGISALFGTVFDNLEQLGAWISLDQSQAEISLLKFQNENWKLTLSF
jgi:hypothetical protein